VLSDVCMYCQWYIELVLLGIRVFFSVRIFSFFFLNVCMYFVHIYFNVLCDDIFFLFFFVLNCTIIFILFVFRMISLSFYTLLSSRISCVLFFLTLFFCFCISFDCIRFSNRFHHIDMMNHRN